MLNKIPLLTAFALILSCSEPARHASSPNYEEDLVSSVPREQTLPRDSGENLSPAKPSPDEIAEQPDILIWKKANLSHYESYPEPGSEECIEYSGCLWAGMFAALDGKQTEAWVKANNIIAVHSKDFADLRLKTLRLRKGERTIDAIVYDMCADSDCQGCCTENSRETGFLIDIEKYTKARFHGIGDGVIEWTCLDCDND